MPNKKTNRSKVKDCPPTPYIQPHNCAHMAAYLHITVHVCYQNNPPHTQ